MMNSVKSKNSTLDVSDRRVLSDADCKAEHTWDM